MVIETRQILEELKLKEVIATSPTGAVFLALDPATGREVVIKMVSCGVPGAEDQIRRLFLAMVDAATLRRIQSMPAITDHGLTPEGDGFLVMERIEGETLDSIEELSPFAAVNVLLDVLACIEDLSAAGAAHLNLKPTNVVVVRRPAGDRALVLGFGTSATLLYAGAGVPVPAADPHIAPELVAGNLLTSDQAWRSDLFSFGVMACGLLGAEIEADGYERPRVTIPPALRDELGEVEPLEAMLGQLMDPDPDGRGQSPSDLRDPLIRALPERPNEPAAGEPAVDAVFDPNRTDPSFEPPPASASPSSESPIAGGVDDAPVPAGHDAWPEVLFDDPELPPSLDDGDDTDVQNPVPEDVWVPPAVEPGDLAEPPRAEAEGDRRTGRRRRVSRLEIAAVAVVVVVLGSIIVFTWPRSADSGAPGITDVAVAPGALAVDPLVPPPPDGNLFDDLLSIQALVDAGDHDAARSALDALDERDDLSFSSDESALYDNLVALVSRAADRGAAIDDLRRGFGYGSIPMIRRGVAGLAGLSAAELAETAGLAADLDRGRRALRLHSAMWQASEEGDDLGAIADASRLIDELPGYSGAAEVRDSSAAALEARAERFIEGEEYEPAIAVLDSLLRAWPERRGPEARIRWCRERVTAARHDRGLIADALAEGEAGDPEAGLARLAGLATGSELHDEIDRACLVLEARLAELDVQAPMIEIVEPSVPGFKKNETITVNLRVSDDYRVERVVVHARNDSDAGYLQLPLDRAEDGTYPFVVSPELHGNRDVHFYVVAEDRSGHMGALGSDSEPRTLERKKWFKKLL